MERHFHVSFTVHQVALLRSVLYRELSGAGNLETAKFGEER